MRSGADEIDGIIVHPIDKQPVRLDVAIPAILPVAGEGMVL